MEPNLEALEARRERFTSYFEDHKALVESTGVTFGAVEKLERAMALSRSRLRQFPEIFSEADEMSIREADTVFVESIRHCMRNVRRASMVTFIGALAFTGFLLPTIASDGPASRRIAGAIVAILGVGLGTLIRVRAVQFARVRVSDYLNASNARRHKEP